MALVTQFGKYVKDIAGLENTLHLMQSLGMLLAALAPHFTLIAAIAPAASRFWRQLALARRYFRSFSFINCANAAIDAISSPEAGKNGGLLLPVLDCAKWNFLGMYLFLEALTTLDAMDVWPTSWAADVYRSSMVCLFFALCCSIVADSARLRALSGGKDGSEGEKIEGPFRSENKILKGPSVADGVANDAVKPAAAENAARATASTRLRTNIVRSSCDLFIPTTFLGWVKVDRAVVAIALIVRCVLTLRQEWRRVNYGGI